MNQLSLTRMQEDEPLEYLVAPLLDYNQPGVPDLFQIFSD